MTSIISPYIDDITSNIKARPIPWEGYQRGNLITDEQYKHIKNIDKQPAAKRQEIIASQADHYARTITEILEKVKRVDILQYTLVLANDFLLNNDKFAQTILQGSQPFNPYINLITNEDETLPLLSIRVLATLVSATSNLPNEVVDAFFEWFRHISSTDQNPDVESFAVQALSSFLKGSSTRLRFWQDSKNVDILAKLLKKSGGLQLQYNTLLVLWVLTFEEEIAKELNKRLDAITTLTSIIHSSIKEKIIRLSIACMANMARHSTADTNLMIHTKVDQLVRTLKARQWQDDDLKEDLSFLDSTLNTRKEEMTSFEEYTTEIDSGKLSWTPAHKSEDFWSQHAKQFIKDDYALIRKLARILSTATDALILAVACHDIGAFVKNYPEGRTIIQKTGAKNKILELMGSGDGDLRYEALQTVQILLSKAWLK